MKTTTRHAFSGFMLAFLLLLLSGYQTLTFAQDNRVIRGERPPIDLAQVPDYAFEPGVLLIKINPEFSELLETTPAATDNTGKVRFNISALDELNDRMNAASVEQSFRSPALSSVFTDRHKAWGFHMWYRLEFDAGADIRQIAAAYSQLPEIEIAEPEYRKMLIEGLNMEMYEPESNLASGDRGWIPNDPSFSNQWHYLNTGQLNGTPGADISLTEAWEITKGNTDVIVAILDDGIQFTHPDLAANMWPGIGFNFVNNSSTISPGNHGTHVAGTVAAVTNNGVGVAGIAGGSGTGDGVRLMSCQVFMGNSSGGFHLAPVYAADNGAAISQNSWGYTSPGVFNQNVLDAIDYFNLNGGGEAMPDGGITIFAAGNSNANGAYYPGFYSGAFSVAGTNNQDQKAWYSNFGSWIDISAPGGETNTVNNRGVLSTVTNNTYAYYQGTSMACPHVSGVAALVLSITYGQITPDDLREILLVSVDDHYAVNPNFIGQLGAGRLNAYQALLEAQNYAAAVLNPLSFNAAAAGNTSIYLNWQSNLAGDEVVLAWSLTDVFGVPDSGMVYQPGAVLPGGGIVLYAGSDNGFYHLDLVPSTFYNYKIWAVNENFEYSSGLTATAGTFCEIQEAPFFEDFDSYSVIPLCWQQDYANKNISWQIGAGNGELHPSTAWSGASNAYFKAQGEGDLGAVTSLILPIINLAPFESAELLFAFTNQARLENNIAYQDILRIKYRPTYNAAWTTLATYNTSVSEWTEVYLDLPVSSGTSYVAFEAQSGRGYGICLDNVGIIGFGNVPTFVMTSGASGNGSIMPLGTISVGQGGEMSYQIAAAANYMIQELVVDGNPDPNAVGQAAYGYSFYNITQNHTIEVSFIELSYNISVSVEPENAGTIEGGGFYPVNEAVSLMAVPNEGFTFVKWQENGLDLSTDNPLEFNALSNRSLTAVFSPAMYSVEVSVNPENAGLIIGADNYEHGTSVSLSAEAFHGYVFENWTEDGSIVSSENPYIFPASGNRNIVANFVLATWSVTAAADPIDGGVIEGTGDYIHGSNITLTAVPYGNYAFKDWWIDDVLISDENPYTFVVEDHLALVARFELETSVASPESGKVVIYPNPSGGVFSIMLIADSEVAVYDITGRLITSQSFAPGLAGFDFSEKPQGVYLVKITDNAGVKMSKAIIR